ncbi:hypothetical protein [Roseovarius aestuariivivens]|uniref:hypothetical protein n=1 Tax=Roseovarius aestuariivivens TaxID=1888910 RepID=UPI001080EB5B|nr:hypothetical protein [Roseovarius aestuariivivens]
MVWAAGSTDGWALTTLDLTSGGGGTLNGGEFLAPSTEIGATGTGVFEPFLRLQANGSESGYNTDRANSDLEFDEKAGIWTHSLQKQDLTGSSGKYEFLLDINEPSGRNSPISLDSLRIFNVGSDKDLTGLSFGDGSNPFNGLYTEIWNMDVGVDGDSEVLLDYDFFGSGSGRADMSLFLSQTLFAGVAATDYIVFYSAFGNADDSDGGFEEWGIRGAPCDPLDPGCGGGVGFVPVPAGLPLLLSALGLGSIVARRKRKTA